MQAKTMDAAQVMSLWDLCLRGLRVVAVAYVIVLVLVYTFQRKLQYLPDTARVSPASEGLANVEEVVLPTADGERIIFWWAPPAAGEKRPVLLYFHGNGGNVSYRAPRIKLFQEAGYGVMMMSYRGYGGSMGRPSEAAIMGDARLGYAWLEARGYDGSRIVAFGESIGTGVAVQLAAQRKVAGVVLDSPFSSAADVALRRYPYLPVRQLMSDQYDSMAHIGKIGAPLLIVHGDQDPIVPYELGRKLFDAASEPKRHVTLPGESHTVPLVNGAWREVRPFLDGIAVAASAGGR